MTKEIALVLAIILVVFLVALFMITFVINRRMPKPEGCKDVEINDANCTACKNMDCSLKRKLELEEIREELKKEERL